MKKNNYPFTAIIGQHSLKTALLISSVDPRMGGVLISGPRGSAKSTIARSLADLIPGHVFVNLPLGASEEKLIGSLDLDKALSNNEVVFSDGLLAKAHQGVLYVDEVNLLADHLVDVLLDTAVSGVNQIERDGISHQHAAEFLLIGTMNPDEGELRPQLLDRFGLMVSLNNQYAIEERQQIMQHRLAFDEHTEQFCEQFKEQQLNIIAQIESAKKNLPKVVVSQKIQTLIAEICSAANAEGLRADITLYRAARAYAALQQRNEVIAEDVDGVKEFVLAHRRNAISPNTKNTSSDSQDHKPKNNQSEESQSRNTTAQSPQQDSNGSSIQGSWGEMQAQTVPVGTNVDLPELKSVSNQKKKPA